MDAARDTSSVEERFYAGRYAEILARTIDGSTLAFDERDVPFVAGSLAFVGRVEEARALLASLPRSTGPASLAAVSSRFFLGVALCRAGRMEEAARELRANLRAGLRHPDARVRFYVFQGLACLRYFAGRMDRAAMHALRALGAAFQARFQYGRLLATDLRGHALVQLGVPESGLQLLAQAHGLATTLGLDANAGAIACASEVYAARVGERPLAEALARLEALASRGGAQDSYSKRNVELELARQYALAGRASDGAALAERIAARPVPDGDRRARVRAILARCFVALLREGAEAAAEHARAARALAEGPLDLGLEAEVAEVEVACLGGAEHLARLVEVRRRIGVSEPLRARPSDRASTILGRALARTPGIVPTLIDAGYLGLLPLALGRAPGRLLFVTETGALVVGDHGDVRLVRELGAATLKLLAALANGAWHEKEALVRDVWGLRTYHPERHASLVHTAVSRLRATLGSAGHWIEARSGAYRLAEGVAFGGEMDEVLVETPVERVDHPDETDPERGEDARIRAFLDREGPTSSTALARALGVSEMTALRRLQALAKEGLVVRTGKARATRYAAVTTTTTERRSDP